MNKIYRVLAALTLMLALGVAASAQTAESASLKKDEAKPAASPTPAAPKAPKQLKLGRVNVNGSLRLRAESYGWFEAPGYEDSYTFGAAQLRLALGQQLEKFDWLVEGQFTGLFNLPSRAVAPAPRGQLGLGASYFAANGSQDASAVLKQAYVKAKGVFGDRASSLKAGRFEFVEGAETAPKDATLAALKRERIAQRLIGNFGFSHGGRSFDAVQYVREGKSSNFTFVGGRAVEGVFQLRALKELDVDFWYGAFTKPLHAKRVESEFRLFGLGYHDGRGALKTDNRTTAARRADVENIRINTVGGHYIAAVKTSKGTMDVLAWGAGQFGAWGTLSHRAGAGAFEGGFQPAGALSKWKTRVRAGYFRSTGDGDAADTRHETFFQVLPTPRVYARFPFYNLMNSEDAFAQVSLKPHARVALRADVHSLRLSNANDLWYSGGGAFQETTFGYQGRPSAGSKSLGTLLDLSADVSLTPTTTLTLYDAGVRGGRVQAAIYPAGGSNPTARLFYVELTRRF
ncbi:MAG TPA: alginate export family protein [Pyrinomonadaceae bacterium]|nr:alginate export family protein [Pyrinomonadaceae bacterium]